MHVATLKANMKSHRKDHLVKNMKHASFLCSFVFLSHLRCSPWNCKSWIYTINNSLKEYWQNDSLQNRFGMTRIFRQNLCNTHIGNAFQRIFFQNWGLQTLFISKDFFLLLFKVIFKMRTWGNQSVCMFPDLLIEFCYTSFTFGVCFNITLEVNMSHKGSISQCIFSLRLLYLNYQHDAFHFSLPHIEESQ